MDPAPSQNTGNAAGTGPITVLISMALLTGEDHQGAGHRLYPQVGLAAQ
jgi:hypothetical protein